MNIFDSLFQTATVLEVLVRVAHKGTRIIQYAYFTHIDIGRIKNLTITIFKKLKLNFNLFFLD